MSFLRKIKQKIIAKEYYLSAHAEEETWSDNLNRKDIENAIITGRKKTMICEFCGGSTQKQRIKKHHWLNKKLYVLENVEAEVCSDCGERYFHAKILDAIDARIKAKHKVKKRLQVEVVRV